MTSSTQDFWSGVSSPLEQLNATLVIEITTNGEDWSNAVKVPFTAQESIDSVHPKTGRATGGTLIQIVGKNFIETDTLACRFGEFKVPAFFLSSSCLQCRSPAMIAIGDDHILNLTVTNNGVHFSNGFLFEYYSELVIHDFHPKIGWMSGGVTVTISFEYFAIPLDNNTQLYCKFNNLLSSATIINTTEGLLSCLAPPSAVSGYASLEITRNQVDYFPSAHAFFYLEQEAKSLTLIPFHGPSRGGTSIQVKGWDLSERSPTGHRYMMLTCLNR